MRAAVEIGNTGAELARLAADRFSEIANDSLRRKGRFTVALSGGSTPRPFYRLLAVEPYRSRIEWKLIDFFFGDERVVPADDAESNYRMARETLFAPLGIEPDQIFRWQTEQTGGPHAIAASYRETLMKYFEGFPKLDLILLGLGTDGHTASLFPGTEAIDETNEPAVANYVKKLDAFRLTMTFPVINNAANVMFLVSGKDKAEVLRKVHSGPVDRQVPATLVRPSSGNVVWCVDKAAAHLL